MLNPTCHPVLLCRFTAWLGQNSSFGKQKRLMGELHTRMSASGNTTADRTGMRTDYLPSLRKSLVKPLIDNEKDGVMTVIYEMQVIAANKYLIQLLNKLDCRFEGHAPEICFRFIPALHR